MDAASLAGWLLAGFLGGLADYWLGVGFGLAASPVLVLLLEADPRPAAASIAVAQLASAPLAFHQHRSRGNVPLEGRRWKLALTLAISASSTAAALAASLALREFGSREALLAYLATLGLLALSGVVALAARRASGNPGAGGPAALAVAVAAGAASGVAKAVAGGGYSLILLAAQRIAGIPLGEAVALLPLAKLAPFSAIVIVYTAAGLTPGPEALALTLGALASAPIAARLLHESRRRLGSSGGPRDWQRS